MQVPALHPDENQRIRTLQSLNVLDTPAEARLDRLTHIASNMFNVPIALVSLIDTDRQWFKSCVGLEASETSRDISFCGHAILGSEVFVVNDALSDPRFADNPLVLEAPDIRFYAGCPLIHPNGSPLGTLCLIDRKPREFNPEEAQTLKEIATLVTLELIQQQSTTMDEESQLSNREGFLLLAKQSMQVCQRLNLKVSVAYIYIKGLANYSNSIELKQKAIQTIAKHFAKIFYSSDIVARYDEMGFVTLMTNADQESASAMLDKLVVNTNQELVHISEKLAAIELVTGFITSEPTADLDELIFQAFVDLHKEKPNPNR